jgi:hypothetical protein
MVVLSVKSWRSESRWVGPGAWSRSVLADALGRCTGLDKTHVKRLARRLMNREALEFEVKSEALAAHCVHILESQGAQLQFRAQ